MRERLVRFRHAVHVFLLLDRPATGIRRIDQFIREQLAGDQISKIDEEDRIAAGLLEQHGFK